jgi:FliG N-terminal domain
MNEFGFTPEQEFANMIMSFTDEEFNKWAEHMSLEEIERATYTIRLASQQLKEQMECLIEETECEIEEELFIGNMDEARSVLSKFTLNK